MPSPLKGTETPLDIAHLAIAEFFNSFQKAKRDVECEVTYSDGIPLLQLRAKVKDDLGDFSATYRLDKMLVRLYPVCETIYSEFSAKGFLPYESEDDRKRSVDSLALMAMHLLLARLILLQLVMFEENAEENKFLTTAALYYALTKLAKHNEDKKDELTTLFNSHIRSSLDKTINQLAKGKRKRLAEMLNRVPFFSIPISVGRPEGSKKPEEKKREDAAKFVKEIEAAIEKLWDDTGSMPTKTAVGEALNIGSPEYRLTSFNNKLARLGIDYDPIVDRVKGIRKNTT